MKDTLIHFKVTLLVQTNVQCSVFTVNLHASIHYIQLPLHVNEK